jgi:hypothetical protein
VGGGGGGGGVSRRGSGDRVPSGSKAVSWKGAQGKKPPGSSGGLRNYRHLFERQF